MQLSPNAIADFKAIYRTEYGIELSDAEAEAMARTVLTLFQRIARPLPDDTHDETCPRHRQAPPFKATD